MTNVIEQRVREAAMAQRAGREVTFAMEHGGAGRKLVAIYPTGEYARPSRHAICTMGTAQEAERVQAEVLALFEQLVKGEEVQ